MRKDRRLTQEQLGEKVGVSGSQISNYESDPENEKSNKPSYEMLFKLAEFFGVTLDDMILEPDASITMTGEPQAKYGYASVEEIVKEKDKYKAENEQLYKQISDLSAKVIKLLEK